MRKVNREMIVWKSKRVKELSGRSDQENQVRVGYRSEESLRECRRNWDRK